MRSYLKYKSLLIVLMLYLAVPLSASNKIILSSGRIEFLVLDEGNTYFQSHPEIRDSLFNSANHALSELETHLSYKLSEPVRIALYDNLKDYREHVKSPQSKFYALMLNGNDADISYQIRYHVATHFIEEYLMGLSVREKLEKDRADRIPEWLKLGFIQYFANGINYDDFENFRKQSKAGKFRNINFIPKNQQAVFGSVIWYFFEKEKGKNIDGAFWLLIKNANSFEKSFQYHFDVRFSHWLKNKINDLQATKVESRNSDFKLPLPRLDFHKLRILSTVDTPSIQFYGIVSTSEKSYLIKSEDSRKAWNVLQEYESIHFNHGLIFNQPSIDHCVESTSKIWVMQWLNDQWTLTLNNSIFFMPKMQNGVWTTIGSDVNQVYLSHQVYNSTRIYSLTINDQSLKLLFEFQGEKLISFTKSNSDNSIFFVMGIKTNGFNSSFQSFIREFNLNQPLNSKLVWLCSSERWKINVTDLIQESESHLSFVKSQENNIEILHIFRTSENGYQQKSTQVKGDFFGQKNLHNSLRQQSEFYIQEGQINFNINRTDEVILDIDTLKLSDSQSDTFKSIALSKQTPKIYSPESKFLSEFDKNNLLNVVSIEPKTSRDKPRTYNYRNWFYPKSSSFQLSNRELDLGYTRNIPVNELYNSPLTLFYSGNYFNNLGTEMLQLDLFSNFNRRRIGLSARHIRSSSKSVQEFGFAYRQRQFNQLNNYNEREQSIQFHYQLTSKKQRILVFHPILRGNGQFVKDISPNYLPNMSNDQIDASYLIETELGLVMNANRKRKYQYFDFQHLEITWQNGAFNGKYISGLNFKSDLRFKLLNFDFFHRSQGKYSFTDANHLYLLGGTKGWINSNANTNVIASQLNHRYSGLVFIGGHVRGTPLGTRMGNSFISSQNEVHYKPLKLVKSYVLGSAFWKRFSVFGFFDIATGFVGGSSDHYHNPYNTLTIDFPNYSLSVGANRNPWIFSFGYGLQFRALGTDFRIEFPQSTVGDEGAKKSILLSLGKNF